MSTPAYLGAEQAMVDAWVRIALESKQAAFNDAARGLHRRIFQDIAPASVDYPFIVFQCQSPPRDIRGVGATRVMVDTLYVVKAIAQVSTFEPLVPLARLIDEAMTEPAAALLAMGGQVFSSVRDEQFSLVEVDSGKQYRHFGGVYRIHAQAH